VGLSAECTENYRRGDSQMSRWKEIGTAAPGGKGARRGDQRRSTSSNAMSERSSSGSSSASCERGTTRSAPASRAARKVVGDGGRRVERALVQVDDGDGGARRQRIGERYSRVGDARDEAERTHGRIDAGLEHQVGDDDGDCLRHAVIVPHGATREAIHRNTEDKEGVDPRRGRAGALHVSVTMSGVCPVHGRRDRSVRLAMSGAPGWRNRQTQGT